MQKCKLTKITIFYSNSVNEIAYVGTRFDIDIKLWVQKQYNGNIKLNCI